MSDEMAAGVGPDLDRTALVMADRRGRIAYWSVGATDLFGYTAESMVGKAVSVLVPAAFRRRHTAGFRAAQGRLLPDTEDGRLGQHHHRLW